MKLFLVGDVHWSEYSSILRKQGKVYSQRLENLIQTINWCEKTAEETECDRVVYLGDFFDKPVLNDREISALNEIKWANSIPHDFVVGNHESSVNGLRFSSTKVLEKPNFTIRDTPYLEICGDISIGWLPYITEDDRKSLDDYFHGSTPKVIFSHNDIKGMKFGTLESKTGFDISDIEAHCELFVNGHLHNGAWLTDKILNLGNITGQNFGENSYKYAHRAAVLDTVSLGLEFIENPYAFNFLQVDIIKDEDIAGFFPKKKNMVINFRCDEALIQSLRDKLTTVALAESRVTSVRSKTHHNEGNEGEIEIEAIDGNKRFSEFMLDKLGDSDIVRQEILEVLR